MKGQEHNSNLAECKRKEDLVTYLYGECTPDEERSFKEHLRGCLSCQQEAGDFGIVRKSLQTWDVMEVPPSVVLDLNNERPRSLRAILAELAAALPGWFKYSTAFASALAMILVFLAVLNTQISYDQQGFHLQMALFNKPTTQPVINNNNEAAVREMVAKMVSEKREQLDKELDEQRSQIEKQLRTQISQLTEELSEKNSSQLSRAALELKKQHREELQRALNRLNRRSQDNNKYEDDPFSLWGGILDDNQNNLSNEKSLKMNN